MHISLQSLDLPNHTTLAGVSRHFDPLTPVFPLSVQTAHPGIDFNL